jgi:hypothetical protein
MIAGQTGLSTRNATTEMVRAVASAEPGCRSACRRRAHGAGGANTLSVVAAAHEATVLVADAGAATSGREDPTPASAAVSVAAERREVWAFHVNAMAASSVGSAWKRDGWNAAQR